MLKTTLAIAEKYSTGDCVAKLDSADPGTDALIYAHALLPTLSEKAELEWRQAVIRAEVGEWRPLFFLLLNDGMRTFNQSPDILEKRKGAGIMFLATALEYAVIKDPCLE